MFNEYVRAKFFFKIPKLIELSDDKYFVDRNQKPNTKNRGVHF